MVKYSTNPSVRCTRSLYAVAGQRGQLVEHRVGLLGTVAQALHVQQRRFEGGRQQRFQVASRERRLGVLGGDDLALLGDPQRSAHGAGGLRQDRVVARAAAAADGAAAAVEQPQADARLLRGLDDQVQLGAVQRPVRGQVAAVLVGVAVARA